MKKPTLKQAKIDKIEGYQQGQPLSGKSPVEEYLSRLNRNEKQFWIMYVVSGELAFNTEHTEYEYLEKMKNLFEMYDPDTLYNYEHQNYKWEKDYKQRQFYDDRLKKIITRKINKDEE